MENTVKVIFTKAPHDPVSYLIRYMLPKSRFALADSSHCLIAVENGVYTSDLFTGVSKRSFADAMKGREIVKVVEYHVPDASQAEPWLAKQLGKKYDIKAALGLGISPDRDWGEDDAWYCYELAGAVLKVCGRDEFQNLSHLTETALLSIKP